MPRRIAKVVLFTVHIISPAAGILSALKAISSHLFDLRRAICYNRWEGRLAQWLERCVDIAEVAGSSPVLPITVQNNKMKTEFVSGENEARWKTGLATSPAIALMEKEDLK